jgi:hypothetical protein
MLVNGRAFTIELQACTNLVPRSGEVRCYLCINVVDVLRLVFQLVQEAWSHSRTSASRALSWRTHAEEVPRTAISNACSENGYAQMHWSKYRKLSLLMVQIHLMIDR